MISKHVISLKYLFKHDCWKMFMAFNKHKLATPPFPFLGFDFLYENKSVNKSYLSSTRIQFQSPKREHLWSVLLCMRKIKIPKETVFSISSAERNQWFNFCLVSFTLTKDHMSTKGMHEGDEKDGREEMKRLGFEGESRGRD